MSVKSCQGSLGGGCNALATCQTGSILGGLCAPSPTGYGQILGNGYYCSANGTGSYGTTSYATATAFCS